MRIALTAPSSYVAALSLEGGARRVARCVVRVLLVGLLVVGLGHTPASPAEAESFGYADRFGGPGEDQALAVTVDGAGNTYVTGFFSGAVSIGAFSLVSAGESDAYVAKLDSSGTVVWARALGGSSADEGLGVAVDGAGNVYATGFFQGTADFDPGPGSFTLTSQGGRDGFVVKLDANGNLVWAGSFGGAAGDDQGVGVAVDGAGHILLTGFYSGAADFDPGPGVTSLSTAGGFDIFILQLNPNGSFSWVRGIGGNGQDRGFGIAVDSSGNVYVTGVFQNTFDFDPGPGTAMLSSAGPFNAFALKLNTGGDLLWARALGGTSNNNAFAIAVDGGGSVYLTGVFQGTADLDPGPGVMNVTSNGSGSAFTVKLAASGNLVWARAFGDNGFSVGFGVATDGDGNDYLTGLFQGTIDVNRGGAPLTLTSAGGNDVFVVKLDASGSPVWAHAFGSGGVDDGLGIAVDGLGSVHVAGAFSGAVDFDPGSGSVILNSAGSFDGFVLDLVQAAPPAYVLPPAQSTAQNSPLVFSTARANRIAISDADNGSRSLRMTLTASNGLLTLGGTTGLTFSVGDGNTDPTMTFTGTVGAINAALEGLIFSPAIDFHGSTSLQLDTFDQLGPTGGQTVSDAIMITVAVPPTASSDSYSLQAGASLSVPAPGVLVNDRDANALRLHAQLASDAMHGSLALSPDGGFTYTPGADFAGSDAFTYRASDGIASSSPATVAITVTATQCAPRPRIRSQVAVGGGGLQVTVMSTSINMQEGSLLVRLSFGELQNARVTLNGQSFGSGQSYMVPANTSAVSFTIQRVTAGQPTTVPLTVVDSCGSWSTFVGGGINAGF